MTAKIKSQKRPRHRRSHKPKGISDHAFKKVYWPYIPVVLIIGVLLTLSTQAGAISTFVKHPEGRVLSYASSMSIGGLLSDTNTSRAQNGVASLKLNSKLNSAAQGKANDMASRNYWSHNTPEGNPPWIFVSNRGYAYQKLGENLAAGFGDEQSTINGWMASPPHKENLLDPAFTEVGFGFANNPNYTSAGGGPMTIVVAFYGKPQVLSAHTTAPPPASSVKKNASPPPAASAKAEPAAPAPTPQPEPEITQPAPAKKNPIVPATTQSDTGSSQLASSSSRAQVALVSYQWARLGTTLAIVGAVTAMGIWLSRHALAVRRAVVVGETFAIRHPLMDVGLLVIAALSYLLTQTVGFIQ